MTGAGPGGVTLEVRDGRVSTADNPAQALSTGATFVWTSLVDPAPDQIHAAALALGLSRDLVADAHSEHRRPRLLEHGDAIAVVLLPAVYDDAREAVVLGGLIVLADGRAVLTVSRGAGPDLSSVRHELSRHGNASGLLEAVVRLVVERYDDVLDGLDDDIAQVEAQVFSEDRRSWAKRIYGLKRESLELRRAVAPLSDVVDRLHCEGGLHGRAMRLAEHVDRLDSLLDSILGADLAEVGVRQNEDQRRISAWAAIALVPTVVGAVYGMNFQHMPELSWEFGYPTALGVIAATCVGLYVNFKRSGWLN